MTAALNQVTTQGANGDERGFNEHSHEGVVDDDVYFARFHDMTYAPVTDDPLSATLPLITQTRGAMRRALLAAVAAALLAPAAALADVQQVLLPGPTPFPTPSPPLQTVGAPPWATLTFKIHASSDQRVRAGVDGQGRVVAVRALQRLHLTGTGDYLIVVSAPVLDVRAAPGSQSEPGQRRGQILWSGFSSKRRLLAADAALQPAAGAARTCRCASRLGATATATSSTVTNTTTTAEVAFQGAGSPKELARAARPHAPATRWRTAACALRT